LWDLKLSDTVLYHAVWGIPDGLFHIFMWTGAAVKICLVSSLLAICVMFANTEKDVVNLYVNKNDSLLGSSFVGQNFPRMLSSLWLVVLMSGSILQKNKKR